MIFSIGIDGGVCALGMIFSIGTDGGVCVCVQGSEWDFGVFSGIEGVEKPDPRIFELALQKAGGIAPEQALHIGDNLRKDYLPARNMGMHALLLDRFQTKEHRAARAAGVPVFPDLSYAQKTIMALQSEQAEAATI